MWKDKLLTHVNQLGHDLLMTDFLRTNPEKPVAPNDEQEALAMRWDVKHWKRGRDNLPNLLNQVLPDFSCLCCRMWCPQMDPCEVIRLLEKGFGQGDAVGLIELTRTWSKLTRSPWHDLRTLFAQLKKTKNEINRKTRCSYCTGC
ncbi:hypothetical protein PHMEG_00028566 [Phytophthora megakarya]|uniref:Uncharacterized protein n=1 Tax=Phytophthora megakarya TaxID=4795 RepID=A0A225V789_9STRA|nr:hypothetical protein PHMEG_00028566 [Phytophthora megakarya]